MKKGMKFIVPGLLGLVLLVYLGMQISFIVQKKELIRENQRLAIPGTIAEQKFYKAYPWDIDNSTSLSTLYSVPSTPLSNISSQIETHIKNKGYGDDGAGQDGGILIGKYCVSYSFPDEFQNVPRGYPAPDNTPINKVLLGISKSC